MISLCLRLFIAIMTTLALTILPLPEILTRFRPHWVLLFLFYLQFYLPEFFNIFLVLLLGVILDVLLATVIGQHAFVLSLTAWLASTKVRRFCLFTMSQQMALIGFFCFINQLLMIIIDSSLGYSVGIIPAFGSVVISMLLWPWLRLISDDAFYLKDRNKIKLLD